MVLTKLKSLSRKAQVGLGVAVLLVLLVGVRAWLGPEVPAYRVERRELVQRVVASGRVLAAARVQLGSLTTAQVVQVLAEEGDRVEAGQLLIQLDDSEARAALAQAQAGVAQVAARLETFRSVTSRVAAEGLKQADLRVEQAALKLKRAEDLAKAGAVTKAELDDAVQALALARSQQESAAAQAMSAAEAGSDFRLAVAAVAQARAAEVVAQTRLAQTRLTAPAAGLILQRQVEPGDVVQPGRVLMVLARSGETLLSMQPDEKNLALIKLGASAEAVADAFPAQPFAAEVSYLAPSVDPAHGTFEARLKVASPPDFLRTDMTVSVNVEVDRRAGALTLPADAIRDVGRETWVWAIRDGVIERVVVTLGIRGEDAVEVLAGLAADELVLTPGAGLVTAGKRVRPRLVVPGGGDAL